MPHPSVALLVIAAICATRAEARQGRSFLDNFAPAVPFDDFVHQYSINPKNITANTYATMEKARHCVPVPDLIVKLLLKRVKLCYFYGDTFTQSVDVSLDNAASLVNNMRWKRDRPMALYTFGWLTAPASPYMTQVLKAYHQSGKYNLVVVDWHESGTFLDYGVAVTMVSRVGQRVAKAVDEMLEAGAQLDHIVGHSLGAQVSGHIGRTLKDKPRFVVGLDPAGPLFYPTMFQCQDPLTSNDGQSVTALHTDWNRFGSNEMTGPADFMPHGGYRLQPGCSVLDTDYGPACSHNRAVTIWSEAIRVPDSIVGVQCDSESSFDTQKCQNNPKGKLSSPTTAPGLYYFTTNSDAPYGKGLRGM